MITTKQRARLRALANKLTPSMQIGKDGLNENSFVQISQMLDSHELIKIKVLQNSDATPRELANQIVENLKCEPVQVIGGCIVVYARSKKPKVQHIDLD